MTDDVSNGQKLIKGWKRKRQEKEKEKEKQEQTGQGVRQRGLAVQESKIAPTGRPRTETAPIICKSPGTVGKSYW